MGKHLLIVFIQLSFIYLTTRGIPLGSDVVVDVGTSLNGYDDQLVLLKESHVDDDGRYVEVASVVEAVEEQKPIGHVGQSRADLSVPAVLRDEDEEEEVRGPGYQGILTGLTGIFSNVLSGNLGKVVESTFNFVPPVYKGGVQGVYNNLLGITPATTTAAPVREPAPAVAVAATTVASSAGEAVAGVTAGGAAGAGTNNAAAAVTQKTALQAAIVASAAGDEDEDQDQEQEQDADDAEARRKRKHSKHVIVL